FEVGGDLRGEQAAVLIPTLVRFALDVQNDPARLRVAVCRAVALHRVGVGLEVLGSRSLHGRQREQQGRREQRQQCESHETSYSFGSGRRGEAIVHCSDTPLHSRQTALSSRFGRIPKTAVSVLIVGGIFVHKSRL